MTPQSISVHKQCIQLATNLRLLGFGGSVPGFQHGKQIWEGLIYMMVVELLHIVWLVRFSFQDGGGICRGVQPSG